MNDYKIIRHEVVLYFTEGTRPCDRFSKETKKHRTKGTRSN